MSSCIKIRNKQSFFEFISSVEKFETSDLIYPPDKPALFNLYQYIRKNKVIAALEFGSGWSTLAIALALNENKQSYADFIIKSLRHPNPFKLMTIDCSNNFQSIAVSRIPIEFRELVIPILSNVKMDKVADQVCHLYDYLPPFTADFIYLDGPDCNQVKGSINGFTVCFGDSKRTYGLPMSGDLLLLENFFWTSTTIITDGRGANAQFLRRNFKRNWSYDYDAKLDQHVFHLVDDPWGSIAQKMLDFKNGN